jgi:hypothetical protein
MGVISFMIQAPGLPACLIVTVVSYGLKFFKTFATDLLQDINAGSNGQSGRDVIQRFPSANKLEHMLPESFKSSLLFFE